MIEAVPVTETQICTFLVSFGRIAAFFQSAPFLGDRYVPAKTKVALAALIGVALSLIRPPVSASSLGLILPGEIMLGLLAGFAIRVAIAGAEAGGQLVGLQLELGFAASFDPHAAEEMLVTRRLTQTLTGLAFFMMNGLEASLRALCLARVDGRTLESAFYTLFNASSEVMIMGVRIAAPLFWPRSSPTLRWRSRLALRRH